MITDILVCVFLIVMIFVVAGLNQKDMAKFLDTTNNPESRAKAILGVLTGLPLYYGLIVVSLRLIMKMLGET